jgi:hypothetical protein
MNDKSLELRWLIKRRSAQEWNANKPPPLVEAYRTLQWRTIEKMSSGEGEHYFIETEWTNVPKVYEDELK